jgi:RNA polymerase sigma-B factor
VSAGERDGRPTARTELRERNSELIARLAAAEGPDREELVEQLVLTNLEVASSVARRYARRSDLGPDLRQVACVALVRAAREFDASRGHEFLAYAIPCMTGAIKRYFRDSAWAIRPPRPVQEQHSRAEPGADHVVAGIDVETCFRPRSLDGPRPGRSTPIGATIVDEWDRTWEQAEARLLLWPHLRTLPERAQHLLHRRFVDGWSQQEIAEELGVTQYHVSRLLTRYLGELRDRLVEAA